jgi:1-acyl-sn-glycerol-3-phosphate acyltransferase
MAALRAAQAATTFPLRAPTTPRTVEPLPEEKHTGADFDTAWARRVPARMARALVVEGVLRPTAHLLARPEVVGLDRLGDLEGPAIFAANHHSHVDTPLLLSVIPEPWQHHLAIAAAADYFFGNRVTGGMSALFLGAIPIDRTSVNRRSADLAADLIADGWSLLIFPEGGRSPDGWGQPFRGGAAYLSLRCEVPVVPIHLAGTSRILKKGRTLPTPSPTTVTFGTPMRAHDGESSHRLAERIEAEVAALADESATDWWQARRRAHTDASPSLSGPAGPAPWRRMWALDERTPAVRRRKRAWPDLSS